MISTNTLIYTLTANIAHAIMTEIGCNTNIICEIRNIVRQNIDKCPLFTQELNCNNVFELNTKFIQFVHKCKIDVLKVIH